MKHCIILHALFVGKKQNNLGEECISLIRAVFVGINHPVVIFKFAMGSHYSVDWTTGQTFDLN